MHARVPGVALAAACADMRSAQGFSLVEVLVVLAVLGTMAAIAVPTFSEGMRRQRLDNAARQVALQVSTARLQAVTTNRRMRLRVNCPVANQFRVVEAVGDNAIDAPAARCDEAAYPYPDLDSATRPDLDGPLLRMPVGIRFGAAQSIEISPRGAVTALAGSLPAFIEVTDGVDIRRIRVTAAGQIRLQ